MGLICLITLLRLRTFWSDDAQTIMKFGETESDFFVVLEGQLIARYPTAHGPLDLRTLPRGDVVGEVAVFRHRRTADVVADGPVRLLQAAPTELAALQRRYPRIAAQVYRNLSGVLADRLTDVTERLARP